MVVRDGGGGKKAEFDAIVDGAGGDAVEKGTKILKVSWRCAAVARSSGRISTNM